jgi:subtilisin family serine protease
MRKLAIIITVAFFAFCLCLPFHSAANIYRAESEGPHLQSPALVVQGDSITEVRSGEGTQMEFVPGEVLVKFADPAQAARLLQSKKTSKGILRDPTSVSLTNVFEKFGIKHAATPFAFAAASPLKSVVKLTAPSLKGNREKTRELMLELKGKREVEYAELNFIMRTQAVPNDPYYSSSGAWGQAFRDLWGLQNVSAETAWNSSTGENVVVAVSDSGVDYNHEDIAANIWQNSGEVGTDSAGHDKKTNGIDDDGNGVIDDWHGYNFVTISGSPANNDPMDDFGHGTHVAGTIAAIGNNGKGIVGVAFGAKIMPVKGLNQDGIGSTDDLVKTILYAADNGAKVINASWGGFANAPIQTLVNAIDYAHDTKGVVFVAAAGNSNADVGTSQTGIAPANIRNVITVSAFDHTDTKAFFSNFGQKIDVAAPGGGDSGPVGIYAPARSILSLLSSAASPAITDSGQLVIGDKYLRQAGTSMAAPHVAGVAALIRSLHPELGPEQVRQAIRFGADDVDAIGFDINSGYGRINAAKSLTVSLPLVARLSGPLEPMTDTCVVPINGSVGGTGLSTWRLEFGVGTSPVSWTQITSSGTPISNGQLANWNASNVADGTYTVRLIAQNTSGQLFEDRLPITIDNVFIASPAADAFFNPGAVVTIKGTVTGCTFVSYAIKIKRVSDGQFLTNPAVTITNGGLQRVRNDVLGVWDTTNVPDDRYDIIVEMQQANGSPVQKSIRVLITSRVSLLKSFDESSVTNPVTSDLDGDGNDEIIFTTTDPSFTIGGKIHVLRQDGTELPGWPVVLTNRPLNNTPAIGDVNGDGIPEIVIESFFEKNSGPIHYVYAFNLEGNLLNGFPVALGLGGFFTNGQTPSVAVTDVDLNGKLDIVAVSAGFGLGASRRVVAIDGNAKIIFDAALPDAPSGQLEFMVGSIPMVGNIVGDEAPEIIVGVFNLSSAFAKYYALNNKGQILSGWPIQFGPPSGSIMQYGALADLDGDGYDEIALIENRNVENPVLHVLRGNGVEISGFSQTLPASGGLSKFVINPSFADLNGDGWPEIVTVIGDQISNSVVAYDRFGTLIMNSSFSGGVLQTQGVVTVASNDADGKSLIVFPYYENALATQLILQGMKSDGTRPAGFPIYIPKLCQQPFCQAATSVALLRNIQSTSTKGVIVDASANVFVVDLGVSACGLSGPWPQLQHDARRTGEYKPPIRSVTISPSNAFHPSSGGDGNINVITPNSCGWTASSSASWITITSGAAGAGNGLVNYQVAANTGSERSAGITVGGQTFTVKQLGVPIEVTFQTNPVGRAFTVDGTTYASGQTFSWTSGASHTITVPSPQFGGTNTQWVWSSWSDGGMLGHTVAPTSNTTYIANFITTPCAPLPSGLMAWWRGDSNAQDETGVNNGTLVGNMTFSTGKVGGGFLGKSSDSAGLVQVPDSPSLALNRSMTFEGWLKLNSYGGTVIERRTTDLRWSYQLGIQPTGQLYFTIWFNNNSGIIGESDPLPLGQFVHFAASLDDNTSQAKIYINGSPVRQFTTQRPNVISDATIYIGNINGITDELSVYDRALSSSEIQNIYNAGVSNIVGKCPVPVRPSIFTEQGPTNRAVALDSVTMIRGPFRVLTDNNFSADHHTRVILFTSDLGMTQPDSTQLIVQAGGVALTIENVGTVLGVSGMSASYIIVRLPDGLPAGDLPLVITLRGFTSVNSPTLSIAP